MLHAMSFDHWWHCDIPQHHNEVTHVESCIGSTLKHDRLMMEALVENTQTEGQSVCNLCQIRMKLQIPL
jgi:hypothetical protein